jgi:hypothetical protein
MQVLPNAVGLFGGNVRPGDHYATITRDSVQHRFCQALGIPVRTMADLPSSYAQFMAAPSDVFKAELQATLTWRRTGGGRDRDGFLYADYSAEARFGPLAFRRQTFPPDPAVKLDEAVRMFAPHNGDRNAEFLWIRVDDVQSKAEEWGFKFLLERLVVPYVLKNWKRSSPSTLHTIGKTTQTETRRVTVRGVFSTPVIPDGAKTITIAPIASSPAYGMVDQAVPVSNWLLTEAIDGEDTEWIADARWDGLNGYVPIQGYKLNQNYEAGDVDTWLAQFATNWDVSIEDSTQAFYPFLFSLWSLFKFEIDNRWRRQQDGTLRRQRQDLTPAGFFYGASALWQSWTSEGVDGYAWLALTPVPELAHTAPAWSERGLVEAIGRLEHGAKVLPLQVVDPPEPG